MSVFRRVCSIVWAVVWLAFSVPAPAAGLPARPWSVPAAAAAAGAFRVSGTAKKAVRGSDRLGPRLRRLLRENARAPLGAARERVRVVLELREGAAWDREAVERAGGKVLVHRPRTVAAVLPIHTLEETVGRMEGVRCARLPRRFVPDQVTGGGVNLTGAARFHAQGYEGEGVRVAVIDVGFKGLGAAVASGDLPHDVISLDFTGSGIETEYRHGTACAEIVHEMAPGAELHLLKIRDEIHLYDAFDYCLEQGIRVVSMSIGTVGTGPGDGTGPMADLCDEARDLGILVVASAGNFGGYPVAGSTYGFHWKGPFTDANGDGVHEFAQGYEYNVVVAYPDTNDDGEPEDNEVSIIMRWDDWPDAVVDYDMYLFEYPFPAPGTPPVAYSEVVQDGDGHPVEEIVIDLSGSVGSLHFYTLVVAKPDGEPAGVDLEIYLAGTSLFMPFGGYSTALATAESSMGEPADARSVLAVGAVNAGNWTTGPQEAFSSQGPTNAWAGSEPRIKPDVCGPDGVFTHAYGEDDAFLGTSASAPHVAGAAAAILSRSPALSPDELHALITVNAVDMGAYGADNVYGSGRLRLDPFGTLVPETGSGEPGILVRDDARDRIYLGDPGRGQLVVIDTMTESVMHRVPVESDFADITLSPDHSTLAVAGGSLVLVDCATLGARKLDTGLDVASAAFGAGGGLYLLTNDYWGHAYKYDPAAEEIVLWFGAGAGLDDLVYRRGLVRTDGTGETLYIAQRGQYPGSICAVDISGEAPVFTAEDDHGDLDSLSDLVRSPSGEELYCGSQVIDAHTIQPLEQRLFSIGKYNVRGIATDRDGSYIYQTETGSYYGTSVTQYSASLRERTGSFRIPSESSLADPASRGLAVDRTGTRAFMVMGEQPPGDTAKTWSVKAIVVDTPLTIFIPARVTEGAGTLTDGGAITLLEARAQDLEVRLVSDRPDAVSVPATVNVPAGATTVPFDITVSDDAVLNGTRHVTMGAEADGLPSTCRGMEVTDDESAQLSVALPQGASEGDGTLTGSVHVSSPAGADVQVLLTADIPSQLVLPYAAVIAQGETSGTFTFGVVDDTVIDGLRQVTVTASVPGWTGGGAQMWVNDDEEMMFFVTLPELFQEGDGLLPGVGQVSIPGLAADDLTVTLSVEGAGTVSVPGEVVIPKGASSAAFDVTLSDDILMNPEAGVTVTAWAQGWTEASEETEVREDWRLGARFEVHAGTAPGAQAYPAAAVFGDGGFVVAWHSGSPSGIYAAVFDEQGEPGSPFLVGTGVYSGAVAPAVAALSEDRFMVAWEAYDGGDGSEVMGRVFYRSGAPVGEAFRLNSYAAGTQSRPALAGLPGGEFMAAWNSYGRDGDGWAVAGRLFDSTGAGLGDEFLVNTYAAGTQSSPSAATLARGGFVILWESSGQDGDGTGVFGQVFDSNGTPAGGEFRVHDYVEGNQHTGRVAALARGGFVAAWQSDSPDASGFRGRLFDPDGTPRGDEFRLDEDYPGTGQAVCGVPGGGFAAVWVHWDGSANVDMLMGGLYNGAGISVGSPFRVNPVSSPPVASPPASLAAGAVDGFVVVWEPSSENRIYGQRYSTEADTDDDGIPDAVEDADHDGVVDPGETDPLDADTDGDGVRDGTELGYTFADLWVGTDPALFQPDLDTGALTDPVVRDTDGDLLPDGVEDKNGNGRFDPGETDPNLTNADFDGDGDVDLADAVAALRIAVAEPYTADPSYAARDADGDGRIGMSDALRILLGLAGLW